MSTTSVRAGARLSLMLLGALLAEATLQIATVIFPPVEARLSGLKPRYVSDPLLDVRGDSSLPEYDEGGFRNEQRPARASVVAIGDSQTEGSGVARENAWPQQLAAARDMSVYQMAFGSYGPGHYLTLIGDALSLEPHTVVIGVYTGNDLAGAYEWVYDEGRNPELRSPETDRIADIEKAERERGPIDRPWRAARDAERGLYGRPLLRWFRTHVEDRSKLVALFEQLRWWVRGLGATLDLDEGPKDWGETLEVISAAPHSVLFAYNDGIVRTVFTPEARLAAQDVGDARIREGLHLTLAMLERIAAECRGRARLLVLLIPTKELVFADRVMSQDRGIPSEFTVLVDRERNIREQIETYLAERGIETIDPLPEMCALLAPQDGVRAVTNPYPETWDGHPVAPGYTAMTRAVAAAISAAPPS